MAKGTKITHSTCTSNGIVVKTSSSKPGKGGK